MFSFLASGLPKIHCFLLVESRVICHIKWDFAGSQWEVRMSIFSQSEVTCESPHFIVTKSQWLLLHQTMLLNLDENVVTSKVAKFEAHLQNVTSPAANYREAHKYFLHLTTWSRPEFLCPEVSREAVTESSIRVTLSWWESLCSFQNIPWDILQE